VITGRLLRFRDDDACEETMCGLAKRSGKNTPRWIQDKSIAGEATSGISTHAELLQQTCLERSRREAGVGRIVAGVEIARIRAAKRW
jgi:hypothetical protein